MNPDERPSAGAAPQRVRVTSPRRGAADRPASRPRAQELDEQTALGEVYLDALLRAQARLVARVLGPTALGVLLVAAAVLLSPTGAGAGPIPLDWVVVTVGAYPIIGAAAWFYSRGADRVEQEFVELLRRR